MSFDAIYQDYVLTRNLLNNLIDRAGQASGKGFLQSLDFPNAGSLPDDPKQRRITVASRAGKTIERLTDATFLALVAEFEHVVFHRIGQASSKASETLEQEYPNEAPLHEFRKGLARERVDFANLGGLRPLFDAGTLGVQDRNQLYKFIQERNFIAHGKRSDWKDAQTFVAMPDVKAAYELLKRIAESL